MLVADALAQRVVAAMSEDRDGQQVLDTDITGYVVTAAAGLDTAGYTFAYVAGWADGDLTVVRQCAETVTRAARSILDRLDEPAVDEQAA